MIVALWFVGATVAYVCLWNLWNPGNDRYIGDGRVASIFLLSAIAWPFVLIAVGLELAARRWPSFRPTLDYMQSKPSATELEERRRTDEALDNIGARAKIWSQIEGLAYKHGTVRVTCQGIDGEVTQIWWNDLAHDNAEVAAFIEHDNGETVIDLAERLERMANHTWEEDV